MLTCTNTGHMPPTAYVEQTERAARARNLASVLRHDVMRLPPTTIAAVRESALERARRLEAEAEQHDAAAKKARGF